MYYVFEIDLVTVLLARNAVFLITLHLFLLLDEVVELICLTCVFVLRTCAFRCLCYFLFLCFLCFVYRRDD